MKPDQTFIGKLLKNSNQYVVPRFQRNYVWGTDEKNDDKGQVRIFWNDLLEITQTKRKHFTGSIVLLQDSKKTVDVDVFLIIDGQQRLITTSLLICALKQFLPDVDLDSRIKNKDRTDYGFLKIIVADEDRDAYKSVIEGNPVVKKTSRSSRIWKTYQYFIQHLQEVKDDPKQFGCTVNDIYTAVADKIQVVSIIIEDEDPGAIFESLNYKGLNLTRVDLIKNYLLMNYSPQIDEYNTADNDNDCDPQLTFVESYWAPLSEKLIEYKEVKKKSVKNNYLEDFVRHYLMMSGKRVPAKSVYSEFKTTILQLNIEQSAMNSQAVPLTQTIESLLTDMSLCASYYRYMVGLDFYDGCAFSKQNRAINMALSTLNEIKSKSNRCYLLNLFKMHDEHHLSDDQFVQSINLVESYLMRRTMVTSGLNSNVVDVLFLSLCEKKCFKPEELFNELNNQTRSAIWPSDSDVEKFFTNTKIYNSAWAYDKLLLMRIDWYLNKKEPISGDSTIEHIMPETRNKWWIEHTDESYDEKLDVLGNLSLTGYNSEISNAPYPDKLEWYKDSNHPLTRSIYSNECYNKEWSMDIIDKRTHELIEYIKVIWPHKLT